MRSGIASLLGAVLLACMPGTSAASYGERVGEHILDNGLKVLLLEDRKAPVAVVQVWYRVGSRNEVLGKTGLSHVLEHMMFKGTETLGPDDYSRTIKRNGGDENAFTTADATAYYAKLASDRLSVALRLEADRMQNLAFAEEQFTPELKVVMEERRLRTADQPIAALFEQIRSAAYTAHPYQWPVIGWMNDLRQLTREDALDYYRTYYDPANAIVVVTGDFDAALVLDEIRDSFGAIPSRTRPPIVRAIEPPQRGERRTKVARPAELPFVAMAFHAPPANGADGFVLDVIADILSDGKSSRLHRDLVYERRLARSAGASFDLRSIDPDLFFVHAQPMPGQDVVAVERALLAHLERLTTEPVSESELEKVKAASEAAFVFAQDSLFYQAMLLGQYEIAGSWRRLDDYLPGIRAVTAADVQRVARQVFRADNRTVGILEPR